MRIAIVENERSRPKPGLSGKCQKCGDTAIARCGKIRVHHWAHMPSSTCSHRQGGKTDWHTKWQDRFPFKFQEIIVWAENGDLRIADVKTNIGRVLEIQHSHISPEVRKLREEHYVDMAWVVNGNRTYSGGYEFGEALHHASVLQTTPLKLKVPIKGCTILKTWADSTVGVYFDFGGQKFWKKQYNFPKPTLWRLYPGNTETHVTVAPIWRDDLISNVLTGTPITGIHDLNMTVTPSPVQKVRRPVKKTSRPVKQTWIPKHQRRALETDLDYALRVWSFSELESNPPD
jgi:competence protein CoiA